MKQSRRRLQHLITGAAALPFAPRVANSQAYPSRPIRWVVSFAAGGPHDTVARLIGQALSEGLGQPVLIENRTGAGGNVGMGSVLSSPADGYTIGFAAPNNAINHTLYESMSFDFVRDSAPIGQIMVSTNVMVVNPEVPATTVSEFVTYAKANPGKVNMASPGAGTAVHLSGELFQVMTGIKMQHVPYRGSAPAYQDLLPNRVQVMFDNLPGAVEFIKTGNLRALGVTAAKRAQAIPDVPAIGEIIPGYEAAVWYGIVAPRGTPSAIVDTLNKALNSSLAEPRLNARLAELGGAAMPTTPTEFGELLAKETDKWAKVVKFAGVKLG